MADRYALQVSRDAESSRPVGPATVAPEGAQAAHSGAVERILELQRTAGNRAVVQRLAQGGLNPAVQRVVGIDEVSAEVDGSGAPGPDAAAEGAGATGAGATGAGTEINDSIVRVNAGSIDLNAPIVRVGGVIQADTVIAESIVASNYTPGSGNAW